MEQIQDNPRTAVIRDSKVTIVSRFTRVENGQEYGMVSTTIQTNSTGLNPEVSIQTDNRVGPPRDNALCEELDQYLDTMAEHWTKVKKTLAELRDALVVMKK